MLADSASQREFLVREGVVPAAKIQVLAQGSVCGVDGARFKPDAEARARLRAEWGIPADAVLFLYLGRLTRDKGLMDLARAFAEVPDGWLAMVGPDEDGIAAELRDVSGGSAPRCLIRGYTDHPEQAMAAADVFMLPSYREGFGSTVIEAAACGVPAVASRIYGLTDAVAEGETGFLVPPRDPAALAARMRELAGNSQLRQHMGAAARGAGVEGFPDGGIDAGDACVLHGAPGGAPRCLSACSTSWSRRRCCCCCGRSSGLLALLIRWNMGPPALFRQVRPGLRGEPFRVLKFRTMRDAHGPDGQPLPDAERLTPLGAFIRRTSLDELPQLINVLKGEMSLVGRGRC